MSVEFSHATIEALESVECECGMTPDALPPAAWHQWTLQHLAMHEPNTAGVYWTYNKVIRWTMEES